MTYTADDYRREAALWTDVPTDPHREDVRRLRTMLEAAAALLDQQAWQPMETAPDYQNVIVFDPRIPTARYIASKSGVTGKWRERTADPVWLVPTHWMPLPSAPREEPQCPECGGPSHSPGDCTAPPQEPG